MAVPALAQTPGPTDNGSGSTSMSSSASGSKIYSLGAQNGSNETGTVTLGPDGPNRTIVSVDIQGGPPDPQPDHIHSGTCANLDPSPAYPLHNLVRGHSRTVVNAPLASLIAGGYAVNVHQSLSDLKDYVSCGNLTADNQAPSSAYPAPTATPKGGH
jgi:hypothetical protein